MRTIPALIWDVWNSGGPAIGSKAPHGRVTVEIDWYLTLNGTYDVRWWQRSDNSQTETEIPNIEAIEISRSIDQDAATCTITLSNQWHYQNGLISLNDQELGQPGYFTWSRGESTEAQDRWGHTANAWNDVLVPDALLRTYQGYGGKSKTLSGALADGNLVLTGVWLIDSVRIGTNGKVELNCRDMAKLLIEQQIYPPLVPAADYPVKYCRWGWDDISGNYDLGVILPTRFGDTVDSALLWAGTTSYNGDVPEPGFKDYSYNDPGTGYWLLVNDGRVYARGNKTSHGQISADFTTNPAVRIESTVTGNGYWILQRDGTVSDFGDADNFGNGTMTTQSVGFARNHHGDGYWVLDLDGNITARGAATNLGEPPVSVVAPDWWTSEIAVDIAGDPIGIGYWCLTNSGHVYAFGSADDLGEPYGAVYPPTGTPIKTFARIRPHPSGGGYWVMDQIGNVHAYGTCQHYGQLAGQAYAPVDAAVGTTLADTFPDFPDYMSDLIPTPSGKGYWLLGVSGGVYPFGDAVSFGGINGAYEAFLRINGNYNDYSEIIQTLALWAGFWLYPDTSLGNPDVYGNIETTGAFASDCLDDDLFDKHPIIDPLTTLKEIVGYIMWVDEEGAFHFESPNLYSMGNFNEYGQHTDFVPDIDEALQLTDYQINYDDRSARSQIIISTTDPTEALDDTVTTRYTPATAELLRGMIKPAMWINGVFTSKREQTIMAELIALYIWLAQRQGSVTCLANPAIQINDQVRIWERVTSETYVHYVRGLSTSMDLISGTYLMTLTTHWMGDDTLWAVDLGVRPYAFNTPNGFTERELTYRLSTSDLNGNTATPDVTLDGNLATYWKVPGNNGQLLNAAVEYIEYYVTGTVDRVYLYTFGAAKAYVSVMVGSSWQGGSTIPYDPIDPPGDYASGGHTPAIKYVTSHSLPSDGATTISLPATYNATRIRITLTDFDVSEWGPFWYVGGLRYVVAGKT